MFGECHAHALMNGVNYQGGSSITQRKRQMKKPCGNVCEAYQEAGGFVCKRWW